MENSHFALSPATNWYSNQILDVSLDGYIAYGSKSSIIILDKLQTSIEKSEKQNWRASNEWKRPKILQTSLVQDKSKVTVLNWAPNGKYVVACTEEGLAKLFAFDNAKLKSKYYHTTHAEKAVQDSRKKIEAVCWTCDDTIVTADNLGNLVVWDFQVQQYKCLSFGRNQIQVIKSHPDNDDIVAIGYRYGSVLIASINGKAGQVIHKIRCNEEDIQGLAWAKDEVFEPETGGHLLAVSSRSRIVSVWSGETAAQIANLRPQSFFKYTQKGKPQEPPFLSCTFAASKGAKNCIFFTGPQGEIYKWDLTKVPKPSTGPGASTLMKSDGTGEDLKLIHRQHSKQGYCVVAYKDFILSCGYDRSIVCYNVPKDEIEFTLPTIASKILCMASNVLDPSIVAFATGDGHIIVWKMMANKVMFDYNLIWQKGRCEVLALAWNPVKDNMLAFATNEGRIGIVDALSSRPYPTYLDFKHRQSVYNVVYGPMALSEQPDTCLYSLGDGIIYMHSQNHNGAPKNIEEIIAATNGWQDRKAPSRSEMTFQPIRQKYLALGCDDGTIEIFAMPDLKIVCTLKSFQKLIQSLAWQPFDETRTSSDLLAVASNEYEIHLWSLNEKLQGSTQDIFTKPDFVLEGHKLRVIQVNWSPYGDNSRLLSVSYDGTAQVWDSKTLQGLANFRGHTGRVFCGMWAPNQDQDLVMTGGEDCAVIAWRPSEQPDKVPIKINNKIKDKAVCVPQQPEEDIQEPPMTTVDVGRAMAKNDEAKDTAEEQVEAPTVNVRERKLKNRKLDRKYYFSQSLFKEAKTQVWQDLDMLMAPQVNIQNNPHLAFFTRKMEDIETLVEIETTIGKANQGDQPILLQQWAACSDIRSELEKNIDHLNEFHVNLCAGQSYKTWRWACGVYAKQLEDKGQTPVKAASYYLMLNEVDKAINVLINANFFQAALTIAQTRLPPDHEMITDLYKKWAVQASQDGRFDLAAKCWYAAKDYKQCAHSLSKSPDGESLRVASELLCQVKGESEKAKVLALQAVDAFEKAQDKEGLGHLMQKINIREVDDKALAAMERLMVTQSDNKETE